MDSSEVLILNHTLRDIKDLRVPKFRMLIKHP